MKIGFDAKRAFHNRRGLGNYSRDTIRLLSEQLPDNQYFMFTPKANVSLFHDYQSNCQAVFPQSSFYKLCPSLWRTTGICSDIKKQKIDVFHGLSHELPIGLSIQLPSRFPPIFFLQIVSVPLANHRYLFRHQKTKNRRFSRIKSRTSLRNRKIKSAYRSDHARPDFF